MSIAPKEQFSLSRKPAIAPSLLSADFATLKNEIQDIEDAGADWLHVDVMDGHFVPNLTIGPLIVSAIRPHTKLPLDCHLMVSEPEKWIEPFAKAGANSITIHSEAATRLDHTLQQMLQQIRDLGCLAGVAVNPSTPLAQIAKVLDQVDLLLIMSVNPGFGGQAFIENSVQKVEQVANLRQGRKFLIEIDGGINPTHLTRLRKVGVDVFVAGSAIFGQKDRKKAIREFRKQLE